MYKIEQFRIDLLEINEWARGGDAEKLEASLANWVGIQVPVMHNSCWDYGRTAPMADRTVIKSCIVASSCIRPSSILKNNEKLLEIYVA